MQARVCQIPKNLSLTTGRGKKDTCKQYPTRQLAWGKFVNTFLKNTIKRKLIFLKLAQSLLVGGETGGNPPSQIHTPSTKVNCRKQEAGDNFPAGTAKHDDGNNLSSFPFGEDPKWWLPMHKASTLISLHPRALPQ